jgi:hypothetical protein
MADDIRINVTTNANVATKEFSRMGDTILAQVKKVQSLERGYKVLDNAMNKGKITGQQYTTGVKQLDAAIENVWKEQKKFTQAIKETNAAQAASNGVMQTGTRRASKMGMVMQQSGYQIGDFLVQIQGGTNAMVAFGQQATQMAGLITVLSRKASVIALGAALSILIPLVTALGAAWMRTRDSNNVANAAAKEATAGFKEMFSTISPLTSALVDGFNAAKNGIKDFVNLIANNLDRLLVYAGVVVSYFTVQFVGGFILARIAALSLTGAITLLGAALKRFLPVAVMVALSEMVLLFVRIIKAAGSLAAAMDRVREFTKRMFVVMAIYGDNFVIAIGGVASGIKAAMGDAIFWIADQWNKMVEYMSGAFNTFMEAVGSPLRMKADPPDWYTEGKKGIEDFREASAIAFEAVSAGSERASAQATAAWKELTKGIETPEGFDVFDLFGGTKKGTDGKGGGSDKDSQLQQLIEEQILRKELLGLSVQEAALKQEIADITKTLGDEANALTDKQIEGLAKINLALMEQEELRQQSLQNIQSIADTMSSSMGDAFTSMVDGTKSFGDAMKDMARAVIKQLWEVIVVQKIVGSFNSSTGTGSGIVGSIMGLFAANGAVMSGGSQIKAYANGGVVGGPTYFPMSGGKTGLMGEAGPEAIMPLKRGKDGKLGVATDGGGSQTVVVNQSFNFQANGDESVKKIIAQAAPSISAMAQKGMMDQRRRGGSMKSTFG